jgi:DnaJ-class molecular chaperone
MACTVKVNGVVCGGPQFALGSNKCEKHYAMTYPTTYERLKREITCPFDPEENGGCGGSGWKTYYDENLKQERNRQCDKCGGRGVIDPRRYVEKKGNYILNFLKGEKA